VGYNASRPLIVGLAIALLLLILGAYIIFMKGAGGPPAQTPAPSETTATITPGEATTTPPHATPVETSTPPGQPVVLNVITRHPGEIQVAAREAFLKSEIARRYNIVDVKFYLVDPVAWLSSIRRKGDFDVAWGGGPTLFDTLYLEGLLAPLEGSLVEGALKQIPDVFAGAPMKRLGPDGRVYWVAAAVSSFGFTVNNDVLKRYNLPIPRSWADLASPALGRPLVTELRPMVSIADPLRSTSHTRMYEIILQAYGWDRGWVTLTFMAANSLIEGGSAEARDNVIQGRVAVAITIDFFGYTAMKANPSTEYIAPAGETIVNGDPIALLKTSRNPEAALAFIAWVLTEGQKIWLREDINRLPANPRVFETPEGAARPDLKRAYESLAGARGIEFNDDRALAIERAMQVYFKATLIDMDTLLKDVWRTLLKLYFEGRIDEGKLREYMERIGRPLTYRDPITGAMVTFTEDDARRVTEIVLKDPAKEDAFIRAWREAAYKRYSEILSELRRLG
jgi:ABC-type Fe3+ transport system substrate-binding protein